jgi:hypothetical protein
MSIFNDEWEVRYVVRITFISEIIVASINGGLCWDCDDIDVGVITAMEYCNARSNANWITWCSMDGGVLSCRGEFAVVIRI